LEKFISHQYCPGFGIEYLIYIEYCLCCRF